MSRRRYDLGRRAATAGRTRGAILAATRELLTGSAAASPSLGAIAGRAGVSRLSIYHHFGSRAGLLRAVATEAGRTVPQGGDDHAAAGPTDNLRRRIRRAAERWASDPALFRRLPEAAEAGNPEVERELAALLGASDLLRAGCSLREAEDVIGLVSSFAAFDRLHQGGRRSTPAVTEILIRMAGVILDSPA